MNDEPIPAATLVVVCDRTDAPPELLMVERAAGMAFAAGALVFPGGRIDPADQAGAEGIGRPAEAAKVAAIRETLEETAIPAGLRPTPTRNDALALQSALVADEPFAHLLTKAGLTLDLDALTPFARWLPNFQVTRRFDTLFFIARAPDGAWQPNAIESECTRACWASAADILDRERIGAARLMFPTRRNLERIARHGSFAEIAADAAAHPVEPVTPWVEEIDGDKFILIPDHLGYPVTREKLDNLWRG